MAPSRPAAPLSWINFEEGVYSIGHTGDGFAFDNEGPRHRVFLERFALASRDRFFLAIRAIDPKFDLVKTREFMASMEGAREVTEVPQ